MARERGDKMRELTAEDFKRAKKNPFKENI